MELPDRFVVFSLAERRFALHLFAVKRVVRMAEITPLPKAPDIVIGVVNIHGRVIPVVDIRSRFGLPGREIDPSDHLIIAHTSGRAVALVADQVTGILDRARKEVIPAEHILPAIDYVEGAIKLEDGLVLIHDLEKFLSLDESRVLSEALQAARVGNGIEV